MAAKRQNQWNCSTDGKRRRLVSYFSCEICDSTFLTQCDLKLHQRDKHDGKQWKCKICSLEMKFSRSDLGKYTHFCDKRLAKKRRELAPGYMCLINYLK
jgi:transcription elongation factor Elf1